MGLVRLVVSMRRRIILLFIIENIVENYPLVNVCSNVVARKNFNFQHLILLGHMFIGDECFVMINVYMILEYFLVYYFEGQLNYLYYSHCHCLIGSYFCLF